MQSRVLAHDRRLQLLRGLEDTRYPWPALLREIEGICPGGITLQRIGFEADGRVILRGKATGLTNLASFLSYLDTLSSLDGVDLNYINATEADGWIFDIIGWAKMGG